MTRNTFVRLADDTAATTALEFGIIGNVLVILLFAGLEIAFMIWTQATLQLVADQTARCAAVVAPSCNSIANTQAYAVTEASSHLWPNAISTSNVSVTKITPPTYCENDNTGYYWVITINWSYWSGKIKYPLTANAQQTVTSCYRYQ